MTALTPQQKELRRPALARASQIRYGMRTYIDTLGLIHQAWAERDDVKLGYPSWEAYYNTEFSEERVRLTPAMRDKAIRELRIAGMSQRDIAVSTHLSAATVNRHLGRVSNETDILEGDIVPPARSDLVGAITGAIEAAAERIETAGVAAPAPDGEQATTPSGTAVEGDSHSPSTAPEPSANRVGSADVSPGVPANSPGPAESSSAGATGAGPTPAPVADTCEKCGCPNPGRVEGYMRCDGCDPNCTHMEDRSGGPNHGRCHGCEREKTCRTCGQPLPT